MPDKDYGIWDDATDITYMVAVLSGTPLLAIQSTSPLFGAMVLGAEIKSVEPRMTVTGEKLDIAESYSLKFKAGKGVKDTLND